MLSRLSCSVAVLAALLASSPSLADEMQICKEPVPGGPDDPGRTFAECDLAMTLVESAQHRDWLRSVRDAAAKRWIEKVHTEANAMVARGAPADAEALLRTVLGQLDRSAVLAQYRGYIQGMHSWSLGEVRRRIDAHMAAGMFFPAIALQQRVSKDVLKDPVIIDIARRAIAEYGRRAEDAHRDGLIGAELVYQMVADMLVGDHRASQQLRRRLEAEMKVDGAGPGRPVLTITGPACPDLARLVVESPEKGEPIIVELEVASCSVKEQPAERNEPYRWATRETYEEKRKVKPTCTEGSSYRYVSGVGKDSLGRDGLAYSTGRSQSCGPETVTETRVKETWHDGTRRVKVVTTSIDLRGTLRLTGAGAPPPRPYAFSTTHEDKEYVSPHCNPDRLPAHSPQDECFRKLTHRGKSEVLVAATRELQKRRDELVGSRQSAHRDTTREALRQRATEAVAAKRFTVALDAVARHGVLGGSLKPLQDVLMLTMGITAEQMASLMSAYEVPQYPPPEPPPFARLPVLKVKR